MRIIFVCAANICRSFMAEQILRKKLQETNLSNIKVSSASILDMEGLPPDSLAVEYLEEKGIVKEGEVDHCSRPITKKMVEEADWIFVMEDWHKEAVENFPRGTGKTFLLKAFLKGNDGSDNNISDPYNCSNYKYARCFSEIYDAIDGVWEYIQSGISVTEL